MNGYSTFGPSTGSVWMFGPKCDGSEENILDCNNYETYYTNSHSNDVGVICGEFQSRNTTLRAGMLFFTFIHTYTMTLNSVQLNTNKSKQHHRLSCRMFFESLWMIFILYMQISTQVLLIVFIIYIDRAVSDFLFCSRQTLKTATR